MEMTGLHFDCDFQDQYMSYATNAHRVKYTSLLGIFPKRECPEWVICSVDIEKITQTQTAAALKSAVFPPEN
jgi:hypothetical protein